MTTDTLNARRAKDIYCLAEHAAPRTGPFLLPASGFPATSISPARVLYISDDQQETQH